MFNDYLIMFMFVVRIIDLRNVSKSKYKWQAMAEKDSRRNSSMKIIFVTIFPTMFNAVSASLALDET